MKIYTTGEVSKLCNVSTATVNKWFDSGQLEGYRVPGSRHRRIPHQNLLRFLQQHGAPVDALLHESKTSLLIVSRDQALVDLLNRKLSDELELAWAADGFTAGLQVNATYPDGVLVDFEIGEHAAARICQLLRREPKTKTKLIVVLAPNASRLSLNGVEADEVFERPFDPRLLAYRLRSLVV
jgi:excisionase family DNA binding protein